MKRQYALVLIDNGTVLKRVPLVNKGKYIIGRSDDADLVIASKDVSRHHAAVDFNGKKCVIEDLQSTNGTFVSGQSITRCPLPVGAEVEIGDFLVIFDDGSSAYAYPEGTEIGRKGAETAIIEDKFSSLREKIKDKGLEEEFKRIERVIKKSRKRLSTLAQEDKLTGLFNRQFFDKVAKDEFSRAKKTENDFSLLFIDIDHFKQVNDTYGHSVGDEALRMVAQLIRYSCRKSDIVARYGGEEIVVILPDTNPHDAFKVGQDINGIIARQAKGMLGFKLTVSIGIATFPEDGASLKQIIERADKALYEAKRGGRDQVVRYHEKRR